MLEALVVIAVTLSFVGAVWLGTLAVRWVRRNRGEAAGYAVGLVAPSSGLSEWVEDQVHAFQDWLGEKVDQLNEPGHHGAWHGDHPSSSSHDGGHHSPPGHDGSIDGGH